MSDQADITLAVTEFFTGGDPYLFLYQIQSCNQFGDRMFNLDAGIHFDEIEFTVLIEEFKGACAPVTDFAASFGTTVADAVDQPAWNIRCRCFLDHFLVASLHGTIAFAQPDGIFVIV